MPKVPSFEQRRRCLSWFESACFELKPVRLPCINEPATRLQLNGSSTSSFEPGKCVSSCRTLSGVARNLAHCRGRSVGTTCHSNFCYAVKVSCPCTLHSWRRSTSKSTSMYFRTTVVRSRISPMDPLVGMLAGAHASI